MMLRKFYGRTINEAMRDAREQMGNEVVLIESVAPEGDRPAAVTVMIERKEEPEPQQSDDSSFRNVLYTRGSARAMPSASVEKKTEALQPTTGLAKTAAKSPELKARPAVQAVQETKPEDLPEPKGLEESMSRRKAPLIEIRDTTETKGAYFRDPNVHRDLAALHKRLEKLESMLGESLISANLDYASHPAFQQLLQTGVRATTIASWYKELLQRGLDPYEQHESFMFELAKLVRNAINVALPQAAAPNMLFTGPSGAGKTTLIMKLAASDQFFSSRKVALVSVEPRGFPTKYSGLEAFAKDRGKPFFRVQDGVEVTKLMPQLVAFDQVLFDSPTISLEKNTAFREYWKIRQTLASVMPLEVHYVVNATLEQYYFKEAYAASHPLQPDYVSITHLDETDRWGQLIPFIKTMGAAIRYISLGQEIPGSIAAFSPTWFAEKILSMGERS